MSFAVCSQWRARSAIGKRNALGVIDGELVFRKCGKRRLEKRQKPSIRRQQVTGESASAGRDFRR